MRSRFANPLLIAAAALTGIPLALAIPMGRNPLGDALAMVGELVNFSGLTNNPFAVQGLVRFTLFIMVFALSNYGFMKVFKGDQNPSGKKTANILSFAFAMIGTVAVDPRIGDANASLWSGLIPAFIMMAAFIGGGIYAIFGLRPNNENDNLGWLWHLMGLLLIIFLFSVLKVWAVYTGVGSFT